MRSSIYRKFSNTKFKNTYKTISQTCNNCNSKLIKSNSHYICENCGDVKDDIYDFGNTARNPLDEIFPVSSFKTEIPSCPSLNMYVKWDNIPSNEKAKRAIQKLFNNICSKYSINKSVGRASLLTFSKIMDQKIINRSKKRVALLANCFHNSCKEYGIVKTPNEVQQMFDIKTIKTFYGGFKILIKNTYNIQEFKIYFYNENSYINYFFERIKKVSKEMIDLDLNKNRLLNVIENINKMSILCDNTKVSIISTAILLLHNKIKALKFVVQFKNFLAKLFDISVTTINNSYKTALKYKNIICSNKNLAKYINEYEKITKTDIENIDKLTKNIICIEKFF